MRTLTLFVTHACVNRCSFCCDGVSGRPGDFISLEEAERCCLEGRQDGLRRLVLIGGEPTLHPGLGHIVARARELGFEMVQLLTNGYGFRTLEGAEALRKAGLDVVGLSVHGATADVHDGLAGRRGAFGDVLRALENVTRIGLPISANTVVTAANLHQLGAIVDLVEPWSVVRMQLAVMNPAGQLRGNLEQLAVSPVEAASPICAAVHHAVARGLLCTVEALPLCLMPGLHGHAAESTLPDLVVADPGSEGQDLRSFDWRRDKGHAKACEACGLLDLCAGTYPEYFELYPDLAAALTPEWPGGDRART